MINLFQRYTDDSLINDEQIVFETTKHWINFFNRPFFISLIICLFLPYQYLTVIGLILVNIINVLLIILTDECVVTTKKVVFKTGFIFTETMEMSLTKIESLYVKQNILGMILGYGTIRIKGTGGSVETFLKINKPIEIKKKIQEYSF